MSVKKGGALFLIISISIGADLEWQAEFRARMEQDTVSSVSDSASAIGGSTLTQFRSRLTLRMQSSGLSAAVQFQDSRILGDPDNASGTAGQDQNSITFSQAYLRYQLRNSGVVTVGRFALPLGNQRLFSSNNWSARGRFFEGYTVDYTFFRRANTKVFRLWLVENYRESNSDRDDTVIDGFYLSSTSSPYGLFQVKNLEAYGYRELNQGSTNAKIRRTTYSGRMVSTMDLGILYCALELEGAVQSGSSADFNTIDGTMMVTNLTVGLPFLFRSEVTAGKEYISGDDPATENVGEGFANPYGAGHKWHGYMDYHKRFSSNDKAGLNESSLRLGVPLFGGLKMQVHYHSFMEGIGSSRLGSEIDFVFSLDPAPGFRVSQGYSRYTHESGSWGTGSDEFAYIMVSATL